MTNSPVFKHIDLASLRRCSPWDLRRMANFEANREDGYFVIAVELQTLADFREDQLFASGQRFRS